MLPDPAGAAPVAWEAATGARLRILFTAPYSWPEVHRGGERYVHELAAALRASGHDARIWSSSPTGPDKDDVLGVPVHRLGRTGRLTRRWGPVGNELEFGLRVLPVLAGRRFDVWHATGTTDAAAAAALGRVRRIRSVYTDLGYPAAASRARRPDRALHRFVVRHIDSYICFSEAAGSYLRTDFGRAAQVVAPGVDTVFWTRTAPRSPTPVLMYSGALDEPRKNVALLLQSVGLLLARHPDLEVWLLGDGDATPLLAQAPPDVRRRVTRTGVAGSAELRDRYSRAWAMVLPSHAESFGIVVLEALACGTPVVALRDGGGPAEVLAPTPGAGVLTEGTAEQLAEACETAFGLAEQPGTAETCRNLARRYDLLERVVPQIVRVYTDGA